LAIFFLKGIDVTTAGMLYYRRVFQLDSTYINKSEYDEFRGFLNLIALSARTLMHFQNMDDDD